MEHWPAQHPVQQHFHLYWPILLVEVSQSDQITVK
jgi:hypothetical protein